MTTPTKMLASLAVLPALLVASPAMAQVQTSVSGLLYTDFSVPTDGRASGVNVTRAFLTGKAKFSDVWSGSITYNAYPQVFARMNNATPPAPAAATEPSDALLHNAFIQATNLVPNITLQMGMLTNPWFEFEMGFFGYRMLGFHHFPVFSNGYIQAFDLGAKAFGQVGPIGYFAQMDNGTGFRATENNGLKAYTAGVHVTPLSGLTFAAFGHRADNITLSQADRYALFAGYRTSGFRVAAEGTRMVDNPVATGVTSTGQILSAYTVIGLPVPALPAPELVARVDMVTRTLGVAPTATTPETLQGLVGLSFKPAPGITVVLDDQISQDTVGTTQTTKNTVALHTQVAF